jgi:hypothetical protein
MKEKTSIVVRRAQQSGEDQNNDQSNPATLLRPLGSVDRADSQARKRSDAIRISLLGLPTRPSRRKGENDNDRFRSTSVRSRQSHASASNHCPSRPLSPPTRPISAFSSLYNYPPRLPDNYSSSVLAEPIGDDESFICIGIDFGTT